MRKTIAIALSVILCMVALIIPAICLADYSPSGPRQGVVRTQCDGKKVIEIGRSFFYEISPDIDPSIILQEGNNNEKIKIKPKKSWEITENNIGFHWNHPPLSAKGEFQPMLNINLIDGNTDTYWASRGQGYPDTGLPVWIRIDLIKPEMIKEIILHPRKKFEYFGAVRKDGIPEEIIIKTSSNAHEWTTVYENKAVTRPPEDDIIRIPLKEPTNLEQVWILANNLTKEDGYPGEYRFMLAEVEILNTKGDNVALISRGGSVTTSSTNYGHGGSRHMTDMLWPINYDVGAKWLRLSAWSNDMNLWHNVERVKGTYHVDVRTDQAITEAIQNGCNVLLHLGYGNWQYGQPAKGNFDHPIWTIPFMWPPSPLDPNARQGYMNYVRFMARHYKERIAYYEIWNEPNLNFTKDQKYFSEFVIEAAKIIKEEDPNGKVMAGNFGIGGPIGKFWQSLHELLDNGVAEYVDAFGWHPGYTDYDRYVKTFQEAARAKGFKGVFMNTETAGGSNLAAVPRMMQAILWNQGLGVRPTCVYAIGPQYSGNNLFLLRNTFGSDPINWQTPGAAYYALRTLCTVMETAEPVELEVDFSVSDVSRKNYNFSLANKDKLVTVWTSKVIKTDVAIKLSKITKVIGIDLINGIEQQMNFRNDSKLGIVVPDLRISACPLILRMEMEN